MWNEFALPPGDDDPSSADGSRDGLRDLGRFLQDFRTKKVADDGGLSRYLVRNLSHLWELSRSCWMCQAWRWEIGPRVAV